MSAPKRSCSGISWPARERYKLPRPDYGCIVAARGNIRSVNRSVQVTHRSKLSIHRSTVPTKEVLLSKDIERSIRQNHNRYERGHRNWLSRLKVKGWDVYLSFAV